MKTQTRLIAPATLLTASLLLPLTTHAAPKPDLRVIGHWRGMLYPRSKNAVFVDFVIRPNATLTITSTSSKATMITQETYWTHSGTLSINPISATVNGKTLHYVTKQTDRYTVSPTTLTLDDGHSNGHIVLHRMTSITSLPDPKVIGRWQASYRMPSNQQGRLVILLKPDGTCTQLRSQIGLSVIAKSTYTAASGTLIETRHSATKNGSVMPYAGIFTEYYTVTADTLRLGTDKRGQGMVYQRIKS